MENSAEPRVGLLRLASRLYVPLASLLLIAFIGRWIAIRAGSLDGQSSMQNRELRFEKSGDASTDNRDGLTSAEIAAANRVIDNWSEPANGRQQVLFLGDSQTMAINDYHRGDMIAPQWLQLSLLRADGARNAPEVVLGSLPGLTMPETLARTMEFSESRGRALKQVIVGLGLREWRTASFRPEIQKEIAAHHVAGALRQIVDSNPDLVHGDTVIQGTLQEASASTGGSTSNSAAPLSARVERALQEFAENNSALFKNRPYLVVLAFKCFLQLRDWIFGAKIYVPRTLPRESYRANLQILELLIRYSKEEHFDLVLYLEPTRPLKGNRILASDINAFRADVPKLCERYHVACFDYIDLVPEAKGMWTDNPGVGEPDYAHFTGAAHKLLARHLSDDIRSRLALASSPVRNGR